MYLRHFAFTRLPFETPAETDELFEPPAVEALFQGARGLPRQINRIAHYALSAAALDKRPNRQRRPSPSTPSKNSGHDLPYRLARGDQRRDRGHNGRLPLRARRRGRKTATTPRSAATTTTSVSTRSPSTTAGSWRSSPSSITRSSDTARGPHPRRCRLRVPVPSNASPSPQPGDRNHPGGPRRAAACGTLGRYPYSGRKRPSCHRLVVTHRTIRQNRNNVRNPPTDPSK